MAVHLEHIHAQHENLKRLFAQVSDTGQDVGSVVLLLDQLVLALREHFADEEWFMEDIAYPELNGHRWQHETLLADAEAIRANLREGQATVAGAVRVLDAVVVDHIEHTDSEMLRYFERLPARSSE